MQFNKVVNERKSCRKFKGSKPSYRDIIEAISWASKIPYAGNIHNIKFILVDDQNILYEITKYCQHDLCSKVNYAIVIVSEVKQLEISFDERGMKYVMEQGGAATNQLLLKLVDVGLDGCWLGSFDDEHIKSILKIPESVIVHSVVPVGYGIPSEKGRRKPEIDKVLRFNSYGGKTMKPKKVVEAL